MKKLKVLTVVGTRPEIIRLCRVIHKLDQSEAIEHVLVHTGQNYDYELNEIFFKDLQLRKPDYFLDAAGENASSTIGNILIKIDAVLEKEQPDAFLVLGDTNSCLGALPAKKRKIPVFHMEAGNRCFDQRVPEETNRKIVDHIADINLTYSDIARDYLLKEGLPADRIIKTGSPMFEVLTFFKEQIEGVTALEELSLLPGGYVVASAHREENINSENYDKLVGVLNMVAEQYDCPVIVSTHPRTRKMIEQKKTIFHSHIRLLKPIGFFNYVKLQKYAKVVLSDSGTISEESSILKFPALNFRETHERPEAMEETAVMMVGLNKERINQALLHLQNEKKNGTQNFRHVSDYSMPNVSDKVVRIILSYTDYVNRVVWSK